MQGWQRVSTRGAGWYWVLNSLKHGDVYHVCSLAHAFREAHGRFTPIYVVVATEAQSQIASLFQEHFAEIILERDFPPEREGWQRLYDYMQWAPFGPDRPLPLHPERSLDPAAIGIDYLEDNLQTWMLAYKRLLHLTEDAQPMPPPFRQVSATDGAAYCAHFGLPRGRAVILFPYAQSIPLEANRSFEQLAHDLKEEGYALYTSVAGDEQEIFGTFPLTIPFYMLAEVVEHCGWAVAVRSGICDILATVPARLTAVYGHRTEVRRWGLAAMGLARGAQEIAFDFATRSPEDFSRLVRSGFSAAPLTVPGRGLTNAIGDDEGSVPVRRTSFRLEEAPPPAASGGVEVLVIRDLPPRPNWRTEAAIRDWLEHLLASRPDALIHSCADAGVGDFFEQITASDLLAGRHVAARGWHSVVLSSGTRIEDVLARHARAECIALETAPVDRTVQFGELPPESDIDFIPDRRATSVAGFQFVRGFSEREDWGIWSDRPTAEIRFTPERPLGALAALEMRVKAAVSEQFPLLHVRALVDDEAALQSVIDWPDRDALLKIPLGARARSPDATIRVVLEFAQVTSPRQQGVSADPRPLGLAISAIRLNSGATG